MKIDSLSRDHKHVVLLYSPACFVRKTRSDRLHLNPIPILFRTLAQRMGLLSLRRAAWLLAAPEPAAPPLVRLGPGGNFTRYWPDSASPCVAGFAEQGRPPQRGIVQ